jgi:hypothetical protein
LSTLTLVATVSLGPPAARANGAGFRGTSSSRHGTSSTAGPQTAARQTAARQTAARLPAARQAAARQTALRRHYKPGATPLPSGGILHTEAGTLFDAGVYHDLSKAVQTLLRELPPDQHYFVGLGRDPAPIIAMLQNIGEKDLAVNLPGSSGKRGTGAPWAAGQLPHAKIAEYIEHFVPEAVLKGQRTLVLVDQTRSGTTLTEFGALVDAYLQRIGSKAAKRVAFSPKAQPASTMRIDTSAFPEVERFLTPSHFGGKYEGVVSEHPRHIMGPRSHPWEIKVRPEYQQMREALRKRMEHDDALDQLVAGFAPVPHAGEPAGARSDASSSDASEAVTQQSAGPRTGSTLGGVRQPASSHARPRTAADLHMERQRQRARAEARERERQRLRAAELERARRLAEKRGVARRGLR